MHLYRMFSGTRHVKIHVIHDAFMVTLLRSPRAAAGGRLAGLLLPQSQRALKSEER